MSVLKQHVIKIINNDYHTQGISGFISEELGYWYVIVKSAKSKGIQVQQYFVNAIGFDWQIESLSELSFLPLAPKKALSINEIEERLNLIVLP